MASDKNENGHTNRKAWTKPEVRSVIPGKRTAGGPFDVNDQDDAFYSLS